MKKESKIHRLGVEAWKHRQYYLIFLPVFLFFLIFKYGPMYGVIISFKDYNPNLGIFGSPWCDPWYQNIVLAFQSDLFIRALKNTLFISFLKVFLAFPIPIIFAILVDETPNRRLKKAVQTVSYLPYFISWVVVSGILRNMLSTNGGAINNIIQMFGGTPINFFGNKNVFVGLIFFSYIWKTVGYNSVVYLAAITGIDQEQYEAARLDGASRLQMIWNITIPSIMPVVTIMLILSMGNVLSAGFDQIFNMYSDPVLEVADIIDTYVYRVGMIKQQYSYSAAVGLFQSLVGMVLVVGSNLIVRRIDKDSSLF